MTARTEGDGLSVEHAGQIRRQFGATAASYVSSQVHSTGSDLETLKQWAQGPPGRHLLDIATGGGHTAINLAPLFDSVTACDLTEEMLTAAAEHAASRGVSNVTFQLADAEDLPFGDSTFDVVTSRIAPHHFLHIDRFVAEVHRVLKGGGHFLLEDNIVTEDEYLGKLFNQVEQLRDPTHVRSLPATEWIAAVSSSGFSIDEKTIHRSRHELTEWMDRSRTPAVQRQQVVDLLLRSGDAGQRAYLLEFSDDGRITAFSDEKLLLRALKATGATP